MALSCPAGTYFDSVINGCRNCDYVCADQYGGHEQLECRENCPGYGVSTTTAPADDADKVMWIVVGSCIGLLVSIVIIAIVMFRFRSSWRAPPKPIVHEETKEGLIGKSVPTFASENA